jgi:hypothetical protein
LLFVERVEGVEEFFLGALFAGDELNTPTLHFFNAVAAQAKGGR